MNLKLIRHALGLAQERTDYEDGLHWILQSALDETYGSKRKEDQEMKTVVEPGDGELYNIVSHIDGWMQIIAPGFETVADAVSWAEQNNLEVEW